MARFVCPTCRKEFESESSPALPFCSHRCRLIDLGRWFEEGYSLPVERNSELDEFEDDEQNQEGED
jgi:uncharacterized protein